MPAQDRGPTIARRFYVDPYRPDLVYVRGKDNVYRSQDGGATWGDAQSTRVHDLGTGYGPPDDFLDAEVIVWLDARPEKAFGFQLRDGPDRPVAEGMLTLLRDGFNQSWVVWIGYEAPPGHHNGVAIRVWLTKPPVHHPPVIDPDDEQAPA